MATIYDLQVAIRFRAAGWNVVGKHISAHSTYEHQQIEFLKNHSIQALHICLEYTMTEG